MKRYGKYKDSGVNWLGEIPENWKVVRYKDIANIVRGGSPRPAGDPRFYGGKIPFLKVGDLTKNESPFIKEYTYTITDEGLSNTRLVKEKTLLLTNSGATLGVPKITTFSTTFNDGVAAFLGIKKADNLYLYFLLKSKTLWFLNMASLGQGQPNLNTEIVGNTFLSIPPLQEQIAIAQYLDTKTQKIDKKVKLLEQKIQYYKELRKSIINKAVTKGLDNKVELKESGINWIGKIPKHWEIKRFKDSVKKYTTGATPSTSNRVFFEGTNDWICISDISKDKYIFSSETKLTDDAIKSANMVITPSGSLLYSFKLSIGKVAFAGKDVYTNEAILSIFPNKLIDLEYYYFMLPIFLYSQATENIYGAKMLNQKLISSAFVVNPPKNEQIQIAQYLNEKISTIDRIEKNIEMQITTFKELRKTIINNVVTGKIKVTND